jgi:hypothetical protein
VGRPSVARQARVVRQRIKAPRDQPLGRTLHAARTY